jgi:hypothetical protein
MEEEDKKIILLFTERQMFDIYGHMLSKEYGEDIELLLDILKKYGLNFKKKKNYYYMEEN